MIKYLILIPLFLLLVSCEDRYRAVGFGDKAIVIDGKTGEAWITEEYNTPWAGKKIKLTPIKYPDRQSELSYYTCNDSKSDKNLDFSDMIIRRYKEKKIKENYEFVEFNSKNIKSDKNNSYLDCAYNYQEILKEKKEKTIFDLM